MAVQIAWQYPFAIDSIAGANPGLPPYLDRLGIHAEKQAGDQFDPGATLQAEATARTLHDISGAFGLNVLPQCTPGY
jgi:hypothetical protein